MLSIHLQARQPTTKEAMKPIVRGEHTYIARCGRLGNHVLYVEQCFAKDGDYDHQE